MKLLSVVCAMILFPSLVFAAYQNPTVQSRQQQSSGFVKVVFQFVGNAGEIAVQREYLVRPNSTATHLRNWVDDTKKELDLLHTASIIPALQSGQIVPGLARVEPAPTAKEVWNEKYERYNRYKDSGLVSAALTTDMNALKADLEATYLNGFID